MSAIKILNDVGQISVSMFTQSIPWGVLFGGDQYMIFHRVPPADGKQGGLICSPILETATNDPPFLSLLVFMMLRDSNFDLGAKLKEKVSKLRIPKEELGPTRSKSALARSATSSKGTPSSDGLEVCL